MSRRTDAPVGHECPYRHNCPHLDRMATTWVMEVYQEAAELREQLHVMEQQYQQRIAELEKTLLERDRTIAHLRLEHLKHFKDNVKKPDPTPVKVKVRRRGAPPGHPGWYRREPDHIDQVVQVPAPKDCPHCQQKGLEPHPEVHEHIQEDIVPVPRTRVTQYLHEQSWCPKCRRAVYQTGEGELRGGQIGPVTRAVAMHLRYDLQIPYRKVQQILCNLFGMPLVPASAMAFDRQATALGRPLFEELKVILKSSPVVHADETPWREDGQGHYIWFAGNKDVAVYLITDNRASESAVALLGEELDATLVSDDYAAYNATNPKHQQTCWRHIDSKAKDILREIELADPPIQAPAAAAFCTKLRGFASRLFELGRRMRQKKLSLKKAQAMVPALQRQLKRFAGRPLDHPSAETLRERLMVKDKAKLFTFLKVKGVDPTNNHAERALRFLVIMRKICFGTRSAPGSESHSVLPSLFQTAKLAGKSTIGFALKLLTAPLAAARAAMLPGTG